MFQEKTCFSRKMMFFLNHDGDIFSCYHCFGFQKKTNETSLATIFFLEEKSLQSAAECI